jgi:YgiT-type zinc finger domain-containing protein
MKCSVCSEAMNNNGGTATQIFRRGGGVIIITGVSAGFLCPRCGNAILDWDVAQQVEDLVQSLFKWADTHTLPQPIVTVTFPEFQPSATPIAQSSR